MEENLPQYDPYDWYWIIGGDETKYWSSKAGAYVPTAPAGYITHIHSVEELNDVLRAYGLRLPQPTEADYATVLQAHIDAVAQSRGYADGVSLVSYVNSTNPQWAAEAKVFTGWRDAVWNAAFTALAAVQGGKGQLAVADFLATLPAIDWST